MAREKTTHTATYKKPAHMTAAVSSDKVRTTKAARNQTAEPVWAGSSGQVAAAQQDAALRALAAKVKDDPNYLFEVFKMAGPPTVAEKVLVGEIEVGKKLSRRASKTSIKKSYIIAVED
jgi:hypothetical protein